MEMIFGSPENITSSTNVMPRSGYITGIWVSSASSTPTIAVYDSEASGTSTVIAATFTPIAGSWYPIPFRVNSGCYVVISGTVNCTVGTVAS